MPARAVTNRYGGRHIIGEFPSVKMGRMVWFESVLEMDCLYLLDYAFIVSSFDTQPMTIPYIRAGRKRRYTPDILVKLADTSISPLVLECKPLAQVQTPDNQYKFAVAKEWCMVNKLRFAVVDETILHEGCWLANVKLLAQFARHPVRKGLREMCLTVLRHEVSGCLSFIELAAKVSPEQPVRARAELYALLYYGHLSADLGCSLLHDDMPITWPFAAQGVADDYPSVQRFDALLLG
jgi:hypothetical protein